MKKFSFCTDGTDNIDSVDFDKSMASIVVDTGLSKLCLITEISLEDPEKTYEKGLKDAWEIARKVSMPSMRGGFTIDEIKNIFGCIGDLTVLEMDIENVKEKVDRYEKEEQEKIRVGDEISFFSNSLDKEVTGVVTRVDSCSLLIIRHDGFYANELKENVRKTGRHLDFTGFLDEVE